MVVRKLICLLLVALFLFATCPLALADGTPPPDPGTGNIHPWDNNDGYRSGGPLTSAQRPVIIIWYGPLGELLTAWILFPTVTTPSVSVSTVRTKGTTDSKSIQRFKEVVR